MQLPDAVDEDVDEDADEDVLADEAADVETVKTLVVEETTIATPAMMSPTSPNLMPTLRAVESPFKKKTKNLSLEAVEHVMRNPNHLIPILSIVLLV